jgi:outer membrane protein assembly factor BamB
LAVTLSPTWSFDSSLTGAPDAGIPADQLHDLVLEPDGQVSLSGFFQAPPQLRINTPQGKAAADGAARRCMLWNGRMICADYPAAVNGKVTAIDLATGGTVWTFDLRSARPDFNALTQSLFMARMAVQGSDRLAALFEAYPKTSDPTKPTNCRLYFLVVLDASGALVTANQVNDPVLSVCNHPHPYGLGADSLGDLFISFSPTITSPAPLVPGSPTLVMSYTRDGIFRWKFTDSGLVGGELAVARGLLYPENSATAILTSSGQPAFALGELYGRAVITRLRTVVAPLTGGASLNGYESGTNTARWTHALSPGQLFGSDQVRLATWNTKKGPQTVALTFTRQAGKTQLHAIVARDGSEAFTCNVANINTRTEPQLFEVANGSLALMEGSDACGKCDPPFAGSSAAFHTLQLPYISIATTEPWIGTFGGAGHDHREEPASEPPVKPGQ